jgi:hypothetical protein
MVELYLHSPICIHGRVLNSLSTGTNLLFTVKLADSPLNVFYYYPVPISVGLPAVLRSFQPLDECWKNKYTEIGYDPFLKNYLFTHHSSSPSRFIEGYTTCVVERT